MTFRPVLDRQFCTDRLLAIFPRAAFDAALSNPLAGSAVSAMLYVDAVVPDSGEIPAGATWARPSTCLWMSDEALTRTADQDRADWRAAAGIGKKALATQLEGWGLTHHPWYADNSRETLRDETLPMWANRGAVRVRPGLPTSSSKPRWALTDSFADLFDPALTGPTLDAAVDSWRNAHLGPGELIKIQVANQLDKAIDAVSVTLPPQGTVRVLEPGLASQILKGVIEQWAPARLAQPFVVTISEPGNKLYVADAAMLAAAGLSINVTTLLPDALLVDIGATPPVFWIVEAVASDGPVDEDRKESLLQWAADQKIPVGQCQFLSAFASRNSAPARKRLKDIASGTYCWYLDEPARELAWDEIG